jgi:hypothetical protein
MRTAIDTNILSALWGGEPSAALIPQFLDQAGVGGAFVLSAVAYVELRAYPTATAVIVDRFLSDMRIEVDWTVERDIWELAAERFVQYANRRRRQGGGEARRLISDFVIAAHALLRADRFITLDQRRYRADFPELILVEP